MSKVLRIGDVIHQVRTMLRRRVEGHPHAFKTGWKQLDEILGGGIPLRTTVTIGARPSVGKSAFATLLCHRILSQNTFPLMIFYWSFEMSGTQQLLRLLSHRLQVQVKELLQPNKVLMERVEIEMEHMRDERLMIIEVPQTLETIANLLSQSHQKRPDYEILSVMDHTRLVVGKPGMGEEQRIFELMSFCNQTNKTLPCTHVVLSQLNRKVEEVAVMEDRYRKPVQSDLFGADAVGQFSNIIIMLHRPEMYGMTSYQYLKNNKPVVESCINKMYAEIVKNRDGEQGTIVFRHQLAINSIEEAEEEKKQLSLF